MRIPSFLKKAFIASILWACSSSFALKAVESSKNGLKKQQREEAFLTKK